MAARLAAKLRGGETIELISDLGGGKTTFVQGLAKALGYTGAVTSPTFTLSQIYALPNGLQLHHYDLYRLGAAGIVGSEIDEDLGQPKIITVVEWGGVAHNILPADRLHIEIAVAGDTERQWNFKSGGPNSERLIEGLKA